MIGLLVFLVCMYIPLAQCMDSKMIENRDINLCVLKKDHSQTFWNYLIDQSNKLDKKRAQRLANALKTQVDLQKYLRSLQDHYLQLLGPFPSKTPLKPQIKGEVIGDGFRVQKVLFESWPNHHVPALIYLPDLDPIQHGPWPGILFACGHSNNGKAYISYQKSCALLAQNGFVVLSYDPISQGERIQLLEASRHGTTTHTLLNIGARLVGRSIVWYQAWDGIRALDYLTSRSEIDRNQSIGMTGTSGGGTQTTFLMALDDRIGPAAPSCYTMQRTSKFRGRSGPADGCQHLPFEGQYGIDHIDYTLMRAPKPTAILAATKDFFEIDSTRETIQDAVAVYQKLDQKERFHFFEANAKHGMGSEHRQEVVRWFRQWFYKDSGQVSEPMNLSTFSEAEIQVTNTGQVSTDFSHQVNIADLNLEEAKRLAEFRTAFWQNHSLEECLNKIRNLIGLPFKIGTVEAKSIDVIEWENRTLEKLVLKSPGNILIPALLFRNRTKHDHNGQSIIYIHHQGKHVEANKEIEELLENSRLVLAIDVRGIGEIRDEGSNTKYHSHDHRVNTVSMHIGRSLFGQRVEDILIAIKYLRLQIIDKEIKSNLSSIHLVGIETMTPLVLHAAVLGDGANTVELRRPVVSSWVNDVVAKPLRKEMAGMVVPGALTVYDLPDLVNLLGDRLTSTLPHIN